MVSKLRTIEGALDGAFKLERSSPTAHSSTHEVYLNRNGTTSLRHIASGEVMHSSIGPADEAKLLYVEQSFLKQRLEENTKSPLVLFDVGLGAGTNALASLQCYRQTSQSRLLHLISFETDLTGISLALENKEKFPYFEGFETATQSLLETHRWEDPGKIIWELKEGSFLEREHEAPSAEIIFFDFYSPKVNPELWTVPVFEKIYRHSKIAGDSKFNSTTLFTYSASTRVRVALLIAGFYVGYGRSTGAKRDTTVASTRLENLERPLDARWIERFKNSHEPLPYLWPQENRTELFEKVLNHRQFSK